MSDPIPDIRMDTAHYRCDLTRIEKLRGKESSHVYRAKRRRTFPGNTVIIVRIKRHRQTPNPVILDTGGSIMLKVAEPINRSAKPTPDVLLAS